MPSPRRPVRLLAVLAALATLLVACGGTSQSPYAAFIAGVESAADESSARVLIESKAQVPGGGEVVTTGEGVQAFDGSAVELDVRTTAGGQAFDITTRVLDTTVYLTGGPFEQILGADTWIVITPDDLSASTGMDLSGIFESARRAQSSLDQLRGMTQDGFEVVGDEDVDGIATTHYRGTVDVDRALSELDAEQSEALAAVFDALPDTFDVDVWMDEQDRPVQVVTDLVVEAGGQGIRTSTTLGFRDYGIEVDVEAPADAVPFGELVQRLGGGLAGDADG